MANYELRITNYFSTWWTVMLRPIYFYAKLKEEKWQESSLTFLLQTSWLLALLATIVIFIIQYIPIGSTLLQIVQGAKILIVLPVLITLAAVFFLITLLILGGLLATGFFGAFYALAFLLHQTYRLLGSKGQFLRLVQNLFYSSAALMTGVIILGLMVLSKYGNLDFTLFRYGFNTIYYLTLLYMYGLWAVAAKRSYGLTKTQAFLGALVPVAILLIFGVAFDKIALPKFQSWIT
jgi:hypothetical protein